jgi:hypothetical protein
MRTKTVAVLAGLVALVGFAGSASAASISLIWQSTGTGSIAAGAGLQTLDVVITADVVGISQLSLSLSASGGSTFTGMVIDAGGNSECISPPNLAPGLCFAGGGSLNPSPRAWARRL